MGTKNLSQDEISAMLSSMQVSKDDNSDSKPESDGHPDEQDESISEGSDTSEKTVEPAPDKPTADDGLQAVEISPVTEEVTDQPDNDSAGTSDNTDEIAGISNPGIESGAEPDEEVNSETIDQNESDDSDTAESESFHGLDDSEEDLLDDPKIPAARNAPAVDEKKEVNDPETTEDARQDEAVEIEGNSDKLPVDGNATNTPSNTADTESVKSDRKEKHQKPTADVPPKKKTKLRKRNKNLIGALVTLVVCGLLLFIPISIHMSNVKEFEAEQAETEKAAEETAEQEKIQVEAEPTVSDTAAAAETIEQDPMKLAFQKQLSEMEILREELLIKEGEIADLKQEYELGIDGVEDEIIRIKNRERIRSYQQAIENNAIELNLRTIARRRAYINGLDRPAQWLQFGGEELLYQIRKTRMDLIVADTAEGIDLAGLMQDNDLFLDQYNLDPEKLAVHVSPSDSKNMEKVWTAVLQREKETILNRVATNRQTQIGKKLGDDLSVRNRHIWNEICDGNFEHKNEITALSPQAAKCLADWKDADLFLNGIDDLSPKSARNLFTWKGNWVCLNGFRDLSPDVARHLFEWDGNWISLNGLASLSFEATMYLPRWKGSKLELMGLKPNEMISDPLALKHLAQWENAGGTLYVNEKVRELIQMLN